MTLVLKAVWGDGTTDCGRRQGERSFDTGFAFRRLAIGGPTLLLSGVRPVRATGHCAPICGTERFLAPSAAPVIAATPAE
jgi:hypothetical protein